MAGRLRFPRAASWALVPIVFAAAPARAQAPADSASTIVISAGREIYHGGGTCQVCHGASLEGVVGPTLKAHAWKDAKGGGYDAILSVVLNGVAGTAMVSHPGGISDDEARKVAAYVWAVSHGKANP